MVVSSVPEPTPDHADRLVMLGLEMVAVSRKIQSPVPGHKLEVTTTCFKNPFRLGFPSFFGSSFFFFVVLLLLSVSRQTGSPLVG